MCAAGQPAELTGAEIRRWLGGPRFDRYLHATDRDQALALRLYRWNSLVAAAALLDVCHLEVAIRNAYDEQLSRHPDWAADPGSQLFLLESGPRKDRVTQRDLNRGSGIGWLPPAAVSARRRRTGRFTWSRSVPSRA